MSGLSGFISLPPLFGVNVCLPNRQMSPRGVMHTQNILSIPMKKLLCESIVYHNTVIFIDYKHLYRLLIVGVLIDNKAFVGKTGILFFILT
jgi:hypothetical protein